MMKKNIYATLFLLILSVFGASLVCAQTLATLPDDPAVSKGRLPDGIYYYVVKNGTRKAVADLSVIWRAGQPLSEDSLVVKEPVPVSDMQEIARKTLSETMIFGKRSPESFLGGNGIKGGKTGFVETRDNAVIINFSDINLSRGTAVMDSLLLLAFDMTRSCTVMLAERGLENFGQAVVVSGDIGQADIIGKMKMLSLFVPDTGTSDLEETYRWKPGDTTGFYVVKDSSANISTISAVYSAPRTPLEYMGTVLPVVSSRMGNELGMILQKRLYKDFFALGIPVSEIGYGYKGSSDWSGDEMFEVYVRTAPENIEASIPVIALALSKIASKGVSATEYSAARKMVGRRVVRDAVSAIKDNDVYVKRCIASFLYGSSLSSNADKSGFFETSALPDSEGSKFFNKFSASLLDSLNNLVLTCTADTCMLGEDDMKSLFTRSWSNSLSSLVSNPVNLNDTTGFNVTPERCKIKKVKTEPLSGGQLWTFSNGMKVVYKNIASGGRFWYSMIIRGGTSSVHDLEAGHGAYYADVLGLGNVRGMRSDDFRYLLSAKDITMKYRAGISDVGIYGSAPSESFDFLMKALIGVTEFEGIDDKVFDYYLECEKLKLASGHGSRHSRYVAIDSLMCPGYRYSVFKSEAGLSPGLKEEAESFFRKQFSKVNDGVLVIVGDINEYELKRKLQDYLGAFSVTNRIMPRPSQIFQPISGESTYIVDGMSRSIDVAMSASVQLTTSSYMEAKLASLAVEDELRSSMSYMPVLVTVSDFFSVVPRDRFNLVLSVEECRPEGFSDSVSEFDPVNALFDVRSVLKRMSEERLTDEKLAVYKAILKNRIASYEADPRYWVDMITRRFSDGKDLHSDYASKIDGVTADQVCEVISLLNTNGKVEYIVRPDNN